MKKAVFLDVDDTLIIATGVITDEGRERVINQGLLNQLKKKRLTDLYLFTNMDLSELNGEQSTTRITRQQLVKELKKQGFTVHAVITPADPAYKKGPGKAYQDLYMQAYEAKKEQGSTSEKFKDCVATFDDCKGKLVIEEQYKNKQRAAGQKKTMLNYFLQNKPKDLKNILYFDDDVDCLTACREVMQELITCQVHPQVFAAKHSASSSHESMGISLEAELASYATAIKHFVSLTKPSHLESQASSSASVINETPIPSFSENHGIFSFTRRQPPASPSSPNTPPPNKL